MCVYIYILIKTWKQKNVKECDVMWDMTPYTSKEQRFTSQNTTSNMAIYFYLR